MGWTYFIFIQLLSLVLTVVGWFVLLPMAYSRAWVTRSSKIECKTLVTAWRGGWLTYLWSNEEDGVTGAPFYRARFKDDRWCAYLWSAWRNSANNLRWAAARPHGPFYRWDSERWYFQAGFRPDTGWPVLSAGRR